MGSEPGPPKCLEPLLARCYLETLLGTGVETQLRTGDKTFPGVPFCPAQLSTTASSHRQFASIASLVPGAGTETAQRAKLSIQE